MLVHSGAETDIGMSYVLRQGLSLLSHTEPEAFGFN